MRVNPVGKLLTEVQASYLAGFIDGDGAIMALLERHGEKRFGFRVRIEIKVTQHHRNDVSWLLALTGIGYIRKNVRCHEWIVRDQIAAKRLLKTLAPYSHTKNKQIKIALEILNHPKQTLVDLTAMARLADTLSAFNVRSKNRRRNYAAMIQVNSSRND
ncbi:MAG: LAGLIDADG homing endonuclease [Parcubacteria group bacterium GW2011_GWC2_42_12]|nr:MAG: LAGLIDADG homing endonuclease [Parcubacteria group bacterium GW2011_GWC2_42_12]